MEPRLLVLETSHRVGRVALAQGDALVGERTLDESRRHARDLVPAIQTLLQEQSWRARDLDGVIVSRGPGSYTGLRVGIMAAKTLAFATGCALVAVDTFSAIALQAENLCRNDSQFAGVEDIDVIADAQQGNIYVQRFGAHPLPLTILPFEAWLESTRAAKVAAAGPGFEVFAGRAVGVPLLPGEAWNAQAASLLVIGVERHRRGERDDPFQVEPLYLRASEAERKWEARQPL